MFRLQISLRFLVPAESTFIMINLQSSGMTKKELRLKQTASSESQKLENAGSKYISQLSRTSVAEVVRNRITIIGQACDEIHKGVYEIEQNFSL